MAKVVAAGQFIKLPKLELTTSNLNGLKDNGHLVAKLLRTPTQLVLFQETKLNNAKHLETFITHLDNEVGIDKYKLFTNDLRSTRTDHLNNRRCGVAAYFHESMLGFSNLTHLDHLDQPGRYMVVRTQWDDTPVYFHNVYAPVTPHSRPSFFDSLPRNFEDDSIHFVGGDFNIPLDGYLDASRPRQDHNVGKTECLSWLSNFGVIDAWRSHHPHTRQHSGPGRSNRLDYWFIDQDIVGYSYQSSTYSPNRFAGDHLEHTVVLSSAPITPGQGYWRLPRELLKNAQIADAIKEDASALLSEMQSQDTLNYGAKWYGWLKRIRRRLQLCHRQHLNSMKHDLHCLKMKWLAVRRDFLAGLAQETEVEAAHQALESARSEYRQHQLDRQFDFHANVNERGTSHFFRRPQGLKVPITTVNVEGTPVHDREIIKDAFTAHWKAIMTKSSIERPNRARRRAVIRTIKRKLTPEQREDLDRPLSAEELCSALKTMNPNKSPGPDGWPAAFFQIAPETFSQILLLVFNYQLLHHGKLLLQQRRSAIALLFKAGDRGDPGNFRPIALMSVEVKILSRALAYRLAQVTPFLIHPSQAGFVPGRRLHDHVMLIQALQTYCTNEDHDYFATFLDFSKAYDMVDRDFMVEVLKEMNIGDNFISWVALLYNTPLVQIIFNGELGPKFKPTRGVKQGCPLSCLLFVMYLEPLGEMLRASPHLGIPLPSTGTITSIFFADDSTLLSTSLQATVEQMSIVDEFCSVSGARLNRAKCTTLILNEHLDQSDVEADGLLNILPSGQATKYLGILLGHRLPQNYQIQKLSDKFLAAFQLWGKRARTLQGRKLIVSTMLLSLLWHVTSAVTVPAAIVNSWQQMVNKFVLSRKTGQDDSYRPFLHRTWQYNKTLGLGVPHIASRLRTQRLLRLQLLMAEDPPDELAVWKVLVRRQFGRAMNKLYRIDQPFDFLSYYPNPNSKWLFLWEIHPLWLDIWRNWSSTSMKERIATTPSLDTTLRLPVWLTSYDALHAGNETTISTAVKSAEMRRWCRNGAGNGLRCLADFLTPHGYWPTREIFVNNMSSNNASTQVHMNTAGVIDFAPPLRTDAVYNYLTRVFVQVLASYDIRPGTPILNFPEVSHPFVRTIKDSPVPFESWPKRYVCQLAYHAPSDVATHPMASSTRSDQDLRKYVSLVRKTCRLPPPVQGDLWIRLLMKMLPVNSRFYFLQPSFPDAVCCVYQDCSAVETLHHAFHECHHVHHLWQLQERAWDCYGVKFDWTVVSNIDRFQTNASGTHLKEALFVLWTLLCASILHSIWIQRNRIKFDKTAPLPRYVWQQTVFIIWTASIRRWLRIPRVDEMEHQNINTILARLMDQPVYREMTTKYPLSLQVGAHPLSDRIEQTTEGRVF